MQWNEKTFIQNMWLAFKAVHDIKCSVPIINCWPRLSKTFEDSANVEAKIRYLWKQNKKDFMFLPPTYFETG